MPLQKDIYEFYGAYRIVYLDSESDNDCKEITYVASDSIEDALTTFRTCYEDARYNITEIKWIKEEVDYEVLVQVRPRNNYE